jgi:threonine dehydrogenase-like Zn-dependent dehydrogenase
MIPDGDASYDVIVVGAGASGIPAAIGAARAGANVLLIEEDQQPGGACVDQYVAMINDTPHDRGGVFGEIIADLSDNYDIAAGPVEKFWSQWFLPADYLRVVQNLIGAEPTLDLACGVRQCDPLVIGGGVAGVVIGRNPGSDIRIEADVVVDATGSAEMAHLAGIETMYGRESRENYGEELAPEEPDEKVQLCTWQYISQNLRPGNRFHMEGVSARPLESGRGWLPEDDEEGWARNAGVYLHWGCRVRCEDTRDPQSVGRAQTEALKLMAEDHRILRRNGYAVHLAPKIGIRESRRLIGRRVITSDDLVAGARPDDTVFVTGRGMDIWTEGKATMSEYPAVQPYGIPYGSLVPQQMDGLIVVGKAISGTHLAMSAYRTQSIVAYVGEAGGVAAAMCAERDVSPATLDPADLIERLRRPPHQIQIEMPGE